MMRAAKAKVKISHMETWLESENINGHGLYEAKKKQYLEMVMRENGINPNLPYQTQELKGYLFFTQEL